jgi:hypothetical protein
MGWSGVVRRVRVEASRGGGMADTEDLNETEVYAPLPYDKQIYVASSAGVAE